MDADTIIITNDIGRFCFLSHAEFKTFLDGTITGEKRKELEEKFFFEMDTTVLAREYAKKHTFLAVGPNLHILMTTLRCNHTCRYCQSSVFPMEAKEVDLDRQTAKKIIDTAFFSTAPAIVIEFQGGEPLSNWEILQFSIEYAEYKSEQTQKKVGFALVTNMSLMTLEKLEYLLDHQIGVTTSLDGDEETHNFNRIYTKGNAHKITTDWIREIDRVSRERTGNKYPILPVLTVTRKTLENWKACIDEYIQL